MKNNNSKKLGMISICFLALNMIVGPGIFLLPQRFFAYSQGAGLWPFIFIGIMALGLAMCFAELAGRFESNGGPYVYAKEAFGNFIGLEIGLLKWFIGVVVWATLSCALGEIIDAGKWVPVAAIWGLTFITISGPTWIKRVNSITTISKMVPLLLLVLFSPKAIITGANLAFPSFSQIDISQSSILLACIVAFYGFSGLESIGVVCEQMENPRKNIPKALMIIIVFVAIFYLSIQMLTLYALGDELSTVKRPVEMAAFKLYGPWAKNLIRFSSIMATTGIAFVCAYLTPVSLATLAKDSFVPEIFARNNKVNVPVYSLIISAILASILAYTGNFTQLAILSVIGRLGQYFSTSLAVIKLRKKSTDNSHFVTPGGYWVPLLVAIFSLIPLINSSFTELIAAGVFFLCGVPLYFYQQKKLLSISKNSRLECDLKHFLPLEGEIQKGRQPILGGIYGK